MLRMARRAAASAVLLALADPALAQDPPLLAVQGSLMSGGWSRLTVEAPTEIGVPALLLAGLTPLPLEAPVATSKGDWYVGDLILVLFLGPVPASGMVDVTFALPPVEPLLYGTTLALQAYVPSRLSNPATVPLDEPYLLASQTKKLTAPVPKLGANFGDTSCVGDFNGDGARDIAVGSWFEDYQGIDKSGRVYVFWGPDFATSTALQSDQPKLFGEFGASLNAADLDNDGASDLVVGEKIGDPPPPGARGRMHVYWGGNPFSTVPGLEITHADIALDNFGRVATVADLDADGWADVAVSPMHATVQGFVEAGKIEVYWGPDFVAESTLISPDNGPSAFFGNALATGDVDGDGYVDLVEGSGRDDVDGVNNAGSVHVFAGGTRALPHLATLTSPLPKFFNARFGDAVAAGDVNGDGVAEIAIEELSERPMLFWDLTGTNFTIMDKPPSASTLPPSENVYSEFLLIGDVNHDGLADVLISDYIDGLLTGCPVGSAGVLYVALAPYFTCYLTITDPAQECLSAFSWRPTIADIDGDALLELVVPSPTADEPGVPNAGHINVFDND
jgi:hypothetical protein